MYVYYEDLDFGYIDVKRVHLLMSLYIFIKDFDLRNIFFFLF